MGSANVAGRVISVVSNFSHQPSLGIFIHKFTIDDLKSVYTCVYTWRLLDLCWRKSKTKKGSPFLNSICRWWPGHGRVTPPEMLCPLNEWSNKLTYTHTHIRPHLEGMLHKLENLLFLRFFFWNIAKPSTSLNTITSKAKLAEERNATVRKLQKKKEMRSFRRGSAGSVRLGCIRSLLSGGGTTARCTHIQTAAVNN